MSSLLFLKFLTNAANLYPFLMISFWNLSKTGCFFEKTFFYVGYFYIFVYWIVVCKCPQNEHFTRN